MPGGKHLRHDFAKQQDEDGQKECQYKALPEDGSKMEDVGKKEVAEQDDGDVGQAVDKQQGRRIAAGGVLRR